MKRSLRGLMAVILGGSGALAMAAPLPNYDAAMAEADAGTRPSAQSAKSAKSGAPKQDFKPTALSRRPGGEQVQVSAAVDPRLGVRTFIQAGPAEPALFSFAFRPEMRAEQSARAFLRRSGGPMGIAAADADEAKLVDKHDTGRGPVIVNLQQVHDGLEVFGRRVGVALDRDLRPLAAAGYFAPRKRSDPAAKRAEAGFILSAEQAIARAAAESGVFLRPDALTAVGRAGAYTRFRVGAQRGEYRVTGTPRAKRVYYPLGGRMVPAWYLELRVSSIDLANRYPYGYVVSAEDGRVLFRNLQMAHAAFSYRTYADSTGKMAPYDSPLGNVRVPAPVLDPRQQFPRIVLPANLVTLAHGPIATGDPWLPADATETVGNNVDAYVDLFPPDGLQQEAGDFRARITGPRIFDYVLGADLDPSTSQGRNAAIVSLFYVNNYLHDWWYGNGFDEAAGNAQMDNFGRGGLGGDPLLAEAHDYSGRNNANMWTPADGESPVMQMYLFNGHDSVRLTATGLGELAAGVANFGPQDFDLTGALAAAVPADGCEALSNPVEVADKIVLIDRGGCRFEEKVWNAELAGARGVLIADYVDDEWPPAVTGEADPGVTIPALGITHAAGQQLRAALPGGVSVTMSRAIGKDLDGSLDNAVVAHEWFHYVSARLVGDGNGLFNNQGMGLGEGWADFSALMLMVRPDDLEVASNAGFRGAYPIGTWVLRGDYFGIRRAPYSVDPSIFPLTFKHIENGVQLPNTAPIAFDRAHNAEPHNAGEIWANTLWDFYVSLLNDPRYSFEQAQERMKDYVIAGLKLTPMAPTFLEARDGLLTAVKATDADDYQLAIRSFAKYGMGMGALAPERWSTSHAGVRESFAARARVFELVDAELDTQYESADGGYCDGDDVWDVGETVLLTLSVRDTGNVALPSGLTAKLSSEADVEFGNGGIVTFGPFGEDGIATGSIPMALRSAGTAEMLVLDVEFPQVGEADFDVLEPDPVSFYTFVNYDLRKNVYNVDDVERVPATLADWTTALEGTGDSWDVYDLGDSNAWYVPDNPMQSEAMLISPTIEVGAGDFSFSFDTDYQFEFHPDYYCGMEEQPAYCDGGTVEISVDDGPWRDVFSVGGAFTEGGYDGPVAALDPESPLQGYGGISPAVSRQTIAFGNALAGSRVRFRFRMATDLVGGDWGWMVDNIRVSGAVEPPFSAMIDNAGVCVNRPPRAVVPALLTVPERLPGQTEQALIELAGAAVDLDGGASLQYRWVQTGGDPVELQGADTATLRFYAPRISADTLLSFDLTVSDGEYEDTASASVLVTDVASAPVVDAGAPQGVKRRDKVTLRGTAWDPDGEAMTYAWRQTAGPRVDLRGADTLTPTFRAEVAERLEFELTVTDAAGLSSTAATSVDVKRGGGGADWLLLPLGLAGLAARRRFRGVGVR